MTSIAGYDYLLSGESWADPSHITYSIAPDGVFWDHGTNNLNATFNAKFGTDGTWQKQIARALATWESVANINIVPVADGTYDFNALGSSQGDPRFGDIRFGGYAFPGNTTTLAQTYFPPPNGSTAAGDVEVNTSMNFNIGSAYDVYSVLLHETGHSLGLDHPKNPNVVMTPNYGGVRTGLTAGDIAGIQAIYGARTPDAYQRIGQGLSFSTPIDVSAGLSGSNQAVVSSASLTSIGSSEYFSFVAPAYAAGTLQVTAAAANISMLSPSVSVFDASGKLLAAGEQSVGLERQRDGDGGGRGARPALLRLGHRRDRRRVQRRRLSPRASRLPSSTPAAPPPPPLPPSTGPPLRPPAPRPSLPTPSSRTTHSPRRGRSGASPSQTVGGVNLNTRSGCGLLQVSDGLPGPYQVSAPGTLIQVYNARGRFVAGGLDIVNLPSARAGTAFVHQDRFAELRAGRELQPLDRAPPRPRCEPQDGPAKASRDGRGPSPGDRPSAWRPAAFDRDPRHGAGVARTSPLAGRSCMPREVCRSSSACDLRAGRCLELEADDASTPAQRVAASRPARDRAFRADPASASPATGI